MIRTSRVLLLVLLASLAGCGLAVPEGGLLGEAPRSLTGFPRQTSEGEVYATSSFDDHENVLGADLVEELRVVPIRLHAERYADRGTARAIQLFPRQMHFRLVFPDGLTLERVTADDFGDELDDEDVSRRIGLNRFKGGPLKEEPMDGYIYFQAPKTESLVFDGAKVFHEVGGVVYQYHLRDSLLVFDLAIGDGRTEQTFYVGVDG